jgi:uncharacterized protein (DUF2249 family)
MKESKLIISPRTRVGELLDAFPALEPVLMAMSPAFEKLKNPVLRRTVAKVATLQQVAVVGGVNIDEMVRLLRIKAGQGDLESGLVNNEYQSAGIPDWFDNTRITVRLDATPVINSGESPMKEILHKAGLLKQGEIFELETPFTPAPVIDMLKTKNFKTYTIVNKDRVLTYISK